MATQGLPKASMFFPQKPAKNPKLVTLTLKQFQCFFKKIEDFAFPACYVSMATDRTDSTYVHM
jgi:hypothetical protein